MSLRITTIFTNSKVVIAAGSALMIALMVGLTIIGLSDMSSINHSLQAISQQHNARVDFLVSMRRIVREHNIYRWAASLVRELSEVRLDRPEPLKIR